MLRSLAALAAAAAVGMALPLRGRVVTLLEVAVVAAVYLAVATATGELSRADLDLVRKVLLRRSRGA
jgi:hypothetical protein